MVEIIQRERTHPEQGFRSCIGIIGSPIKLDGMVEAFVDHGEGATRSKALVRPSGSHEVDS